ncbi:MAG: type I restriction endonuclease subunit R [Ignavibacteriales bacterium]|jgi:type I restriction enzyme R subunit|nr:MAG: type I restriction endonuclease subunit R [Ignavibacteriales bacterium]
MNKHHEIRIEEVCEKSLVSEGYISVRDKYTIHSQPSSKLIDFNPQSALIESVLIEYVKTSQPKAWKAHTNNYPSTSEKALIDRTIQEIKRRGIIDVLRKGITDRGVEFRLIRFTPNTSMNAELTYQYDANTFYVARQLHYSNLNKDLSLDTVLFVNGLPLVTIEFKNEYTGQNYENAITQYKTDRDSREPIFEFKRRTLVHFAVDTTNAYMTTRLEDEATRFLPFNQGSNGAGNVGGSGNPINTNDYDTSYLWNHVLTKDNLLNILNRFVHYQQDINEETGEVEKEYIIFPRYHQLDVVSKIIDDVSENGSGKNYLIEHSAGSGKSNSIAWLAHRLSTLHKNDQKVFNTIIVVTDRKVLDSQLQSTIYQFDHTPGVVVKIDKGKTSKDLLKAINDGKQIIITTIQKFPNIYQDIVQNNRNFAVIVDEAHQSQTGETAKALKQGLANIEETLKYYAELQEIEEEKLKDDLETLEILSQGSHNNLSFFAFTATPKNKTLQLFGVPYEEDGKRKYRPFHVYSMKQAIEEGFILDVLKNYMAYETYFKIAKSVADDPEMEIKSAAKEVLKYQSLHPYNISQKTAIMLDHFSHITKNKIGGKAKAMVVTSSRLSAVRYYYEFAKQISEKQMTGLDILVAFSGVVEDQGTEYTEQGINKTKEGRVISETQLPREFERNFNCLIVAEKYQTGFDEPLLHTMFVDKRLTGVKAVQTLSRLNRIVKGKEDTFILDFVNHVDEIKKSFQPYYEATILENETNPNVMYDIKNQLDNMQIYRTEEIVGFNTIYFSREEKNASKFSNFLRPAIDRYNLLDDIKKSEFKSGVSSFLRVYSFITNVERLLDKKLHEYYNYLKFLRMILPRDNNKIILDDKLILEYYKNEQIFSGSIHLEENQGGVVPIQGGILGKEKKKDKLSRILDDINLAFGTHFSEMDKVLLQFVEDLTKNHELKSFGKNNDIKSFELIYKDYFDNMLIDRIEENNNFFEKLGQDDDFKKVVMDKLLPLVFERIRKDSK